MTYVYIHAYSDAELQTESRKGRAPIFACSSLYGDAQKQASKRMICRQTGPRQDCSVSLELDISLELSSRSVEEFEEDRQMGGCLSCKPSLPLDCVRVVHLSGYVEEFPVAVTVAQVTRGKPSAQTHFVCSSGRLLSSGFSQRMPLDAHLQPGNIYLLLPYSIFQSDSSPVDLASLATRLTAIAKRSGPASPINTADIGIGQHENTGCGAARKMTSTGSGPTFRTWKPILEAIEEKSIDQRSSDYFPQM